MRTITFYSFKGGAGRTLALVNVGSELAKRGKTVLLVDFDLEAPGLASFGEFKAASEHLGLVDYVARYIETAEAPDVTEYLCRGQLPGDEGGALWLMPAGRQDGTYGEQLGRIDWTDLYERRHGFLMFEDMKAQWDAVIRPDYVLIDSRTGYTDVGGICTRHLADAVVLMLFPNQQNIAGIAEIAETIRDEERTPRKKRIDLHFVISNVPDIDDEEDVLARMREAAERDIGFSEPDATIHHYPSLALLEQTVFTRERPDTRLAKEYRRLTGVLMRSNLGDRDGVLESLARDPRRPAWSRPRPRTRAREDDERRLQEIAERYPADGEVAERLAAAFLDRRDPGRAVVSVRRALALGHETVSLRLMAATAELLTGAVESAKTHLEVVLSSDAATPFETITAVRNLSALDEVEAIPIHEFPAVGRLSVRDRLFLAKGLAGETPGGQYAERLLTGVLSDAEPGDRLCEEARSELLMVLIRNRKPEAALALFNTRPTASENAQDVFNYAMAEWAVRGVPPVDLFARVIELAPAVRGANLPQCLAIAHGLSGSPERARKYVEEARTALFKADRQFSAWRYSRVSAEQFLADLDVIERLIDGEAPTPEFFPTGPGTANSEPL